MNRGEYLAWAKARALEYVVIGELSQAYASMASDLLKNPETADHPAIRLGMVELMAGHLATPEAMQRFIDGFR